MLLQRFPPSTATIYSFGELAKAQTATEAPFGVLTFVRAVPCILAGSTSKPTGSSNAQRTTPKVLLLSFTCLSDHHT